MGKLKALAIVIIFLVVVGGVTWLCLNRINRDKVVQVDNFLANIEALASGESGGTVCVGSGTVDCPGTSHKVKELIHY